MKLFLVLSGINRKSSLKVITEVKLKETAVVLGGGGNNGRFELVHCLLTNFTYAKCRTTFFHLVFLYLPTFIQGRMLIIFRLPHKGRFLMTEFHFRLHKFKRSFVYKIMIQFQKIKMSQNLASLIDYIPRNYIKNVILSVH